MSIFTSIVMGFLFLQALPSLLLGGRIKGTKLQKKQQIQHNTIFRGAQQTSSHAKFVLTMQMLRVKMRIIYLIIYGDRVVTTRRRRLRLS